ncbi:MAG: 4-hydroxy-tetrahydrodipicolinate reductase [Alphaproteobacteria bacterium]|nr:4-hydroxy-tetrahydrodipicolinate reductase [Alphaproteobacteria bacterium]MCL2505131.1 4-hydroxy-tetrahydrodipicolinate reductase [Alphaproteobacteria bacterium]
MISVLINGAKGRMGTLAAGAISSDSDFALVGQTDKEDNLEEAIKAYKPQVVIDFTFAGLGHENFLKIINAGAQPVIGTSGFTGEQVASLRKVCDEKKIGGIIVPNFAIGAVLLMKFAKEAAKYMPYVEIIESHHEKKLDAPSGTAVRTAELIAEGRAEAAMQVPGELGEINEFRGGEVRGVRIHSIRRTGVIAQEKVIFGDTGQTLSIEHDSSDRSSFSAGIRLAAKNIVGKKTLLYGLEEVM